MRKILIRHDYRVLCADAGTEGLSLIRSQCPDLVLLDLGLPDMNGNQIIQDVKIQDFWIAVQRLQLPVWQQKW